MLPEKTEKPDYANHTDLHVIIGVLGIIPAFGVLVAIASFIYAAGEWEENTFNLAREAALFGYLIAAVQLVHLFAWWHL